MRKQIFLITMVVFFSSCAKKETSAPAFVIPPTPVVSVEAEARDVPLYVEAMGTIKASQMVEVTPQVTGRIHKVHFSEGDNVQEGDLLYTIDETVYAIKVQELEACLLLDIAHLNNANKKFARYKCLSKQDLIAQVEWDELETKIALCEAQVRADEARLAAARLDVSRCLIRAPISGRAGKVDLQAGNMCREAPLVTLYKTTPLCVDFAVTEKEMQSLSSGDLKVEIYPAGGECCLACGSVTFVDPIMDSKTGMMAVRALLSHEYKVLRPGQAVRVHLIFGNKEQAVVIPSKSVKVNQEGSYVFCIKEDNTVEVRAVKLGPEEKGVVVVEEGLKKGEKVVAEGQSKLYFGAKIEEVQ